MVQPTPPRVGAMPPKAKPKAKALAKAAAKARARGMAMAAPRRRRPAGALGGLRRPAAQIERGGPLSGSEGWRAGQEVVGVDVHPSEWREGDLFVCKEAMYYLRECQIAGKIAQVELRAGEVYLIITLQGTTSEALLKLHSGQPELKYQLHLCQEGCNQQEVSDQLIHARKIRKVLDTEKEEGWVCNLQKVAPLDDRDDLQHLRARQREDGGPLGNGGGAPGTKKKKIKKKEDKSQEAESSSTGEEVKMDGSNSRLAAKKDMSTLFRGTGLDPRERVRRKVARRARKSIKKRGAKDNSSKSSNSSSSTEDSPGNVQEETVFEQASKVRQIASGYPGTLASQALMQMRAVLFSELGSPDQPGLLKPCALAYYRQQVSRKSQSGPAQREMLSIATSIDLLMGGNVAGAMDIMVQRFKSCESVQSGCHWTVALKLEVVPPENAMLTPLQEMHSAQRDVFEESKLRWLAAQPDGRSSMGKSSGKTKSEGKDGGKGGGKSQRWTKGGTKGDGGKKKEEPPKAGG